MLLRNLFRFTEEQSIESTWILPALISARRNNATMRELLPAPVRPATPIFSPEWIEKLMPFSTGGVPGKYGITTPSNLISPLEGHWAGTSTSTEGSCSASILVSLRASSTAVMLS